MRFLIAEDQLIDDQSHHLAQIGGIAGYARRKLGATVDILAYESASPAVIGALDAVPCLAGVSRGRARGGLRGLWKLFLLPLRVTKNCFVITKRVQRQGPYDLLFVPTAWTPHVLSLLGVMVFARRNVRRVCLQFLCCWDADTPKGKMELGLLRWALELLRKVSPKLILLGQTPGVCGDIQGKSDLHVEWMPDVAGDETLFQDPRGAESWASSVPSEKSGRRIVFGFYGFARHEQGVDVLQAAIEEFLKTYPEANVLFNIFWPCGGFALPDGRLVHPNQELETTGKVVFFREPVDKKATAELLRRTDWVLLPYRRHAYAKRSSLLATNSICMGVPGIYTKGTFLQFLYEKFGSGLPVVDGDVSSLVSAITEAMRTSQQHCSNARARSENAFHYFSAARFWSVILS